MARYARRKSESGIFHIMLRGINKQSIFEDNEDRERFLNTIERYRKVSEYKIYGYCLMGNHVHLLLKEAGESISDAIKRICSSYVHWYNWKYDRCGHLFQDRYKSEPVEDEIYLLTVLRYIHQNPVKAGLTKTVQELITKRGLNHEKAYFTDTVAYIAVYLLTISLHQCSKRWIDRWNDLDLLRPCCCGFYPKYDICVCISKE
jgi:REP element-mobilizing transposase RayT